MNTIKLRRREMLKLAGPAIAAGLLRGTASAAPVAEPDGAVRGQLVPQPKMPLVECKGTALECGRMLGSLWKPALQAEAERTKGTKAWWNSRRYAPLVEKYSPHLPDVYRGMARGAGVSEDAMGERAPVDETGGCTSFAVAPEATMEGIPISGQNKDVSLSRGRQLLVLRMKMSDAPSMLTLTYTGSPWLFGHGFIQGGTAIFRNSVYIRSGSGSLPYKIWALLALHCPSVNDVIEMTDRHGVGDAFHVVVADERGGIVGIEAGQGGVAYLRPTRGIYAHANAVVSPEPLGQTEKDDTQFTRADSLHRMQRLSERLQADHGRLTAQLAYNAMCDHDGYPRSVCRHQSIEAQTAATVIAEPTRGLLHVTRGSPCRHWPQTFSLA